MPTPKLALRRTDEATSAPPVFFSAFFLEGRPDYKIHSPSGSGYETLIPSEPTATWFIRCTDSPSGSGYGTLIPQPESWIVKSTFSTVPDVWQWQLGQDYLELGTALSELTALEETDEWKIDASVFSAASYIATELKYRSIRVPQVFVHGPTSVVFNWSDNFYNFYLTVGVNNVSALLSSPERIIARGEYSENEWLNAVQLLPAIQSALLGGPIISINRSVSYLPGFFAFLGVSTITIKASASYLPDFSALLGGPIGSVSYLRDFSG
jgi:hypothetical protein